MSDPRAVVIRPGVASDIDQLRTIEAGAATRFLATRFAAVAGDEPTPAAVLAERIAARRLFVATDPEVGAIGFVMARPVDGQGYIEELDVLPAQAGRRIGAALIERIAALAAEQGWPALLLSTFRDVPWNAPYYRRLGFVVLEEAALSPALREIRCRHIAKGLDESARVFMRRDV
ncbi:GNAT family N-acetyltransferase [Rhodoplanes serenus]|uniref:GNAT family N-acetyltransferase n=1 Tax=Rhodoplanes serenus TaxID=200615 RepID=UPI001AECE220|nr:GNAT family N-acetyltransferase [Rhodoplanes serenus]